MTKSSTKRTNPKRKVPNKNSSFHVMYIVITSLRVHPGGRKEFFSRPPARRSDHHHVRCFQGRILRHLYYTWNFIICQVLLQKKLGFFISLHLVSKKVEPLLAHLNVRGAVFAFLCCRFVLLFFRLTCLARSVRVAPPFTSAPPRRSAPCRPRRARAGAAAFAR